MRKECGRPHGSEPLRLSAGDSVSRTLSKADPRLGEVISRVGSVEVTPAPSRFAALARIILGQQLSESAASAIIGRVEGDIGSTPEAFEAASDDELRSAGVSGRKAGYLRGLARAVRSGQLDLDALDALSDDDVVALLTRLPGVGRWTAQTFLLFAMGRPDVVVIDDVGIRAAAGRMLGLGRTLDARELGDAAERWKPFRSAATLYLYRDRNQTKKGARR